MTISPEEFAHKYALVDATVGDTCWGRIPSRILPALSVRLGTVYTEFAHRALRIVDYAGLFVVVSPDFAAPKGYVYVLHEARCSVRKLLCGGGRVLNAHQA